MKRYAVLSIILLMILSSGALAFKNEPRGFRDLKWDNSPTADMEIIDEDNPLVYRRPGDKMELGEVSLIDIAYTFYNLTYRRKGLASVTLHFVGKGNWRLMKDICRQKFGEPYQDRLYTIIWMSLKAAVALDFSPVDGTGILMLADPGALSKYEDQRQKQTAKEAEKDW